MQKTFLLLFVILLSHQCFSQQYKDSIQIVGHKKRVRYYQYSKELHFLDIKKIVEIDNEAEKHIKAANFNRITSNILIGIGTVTFVYCASSQLNTSDGSKILSGFLEGLMVGGAIAALAIPFRFGIKKQTLKAVNVYNKNLDSNTGIQLGMNKAGIGLSINF